jgi:hypothetical protein
VTKMRDLIGATEHPESLKSECELNRPAEHELMTVDLAKTSSNSSSGSSINTTRTRSNLSANSSLNLAHTISNASMVGPTTQIGYKSFEHHLRSSRSPTPDRSSSQTPTPSDMFRKHTHRHRSHHSHHLRDVSGIQQFSMHDLAPDVVVEAIFNPHASSEEGPFTFVPHASAEKLEPSDAVVENLWRDLNLMGPEGNEPSKEGNAAEEAGPGKEGRSVWGLRGMRGRRGKRAVSTPVA